ncbi:hypothetical protein [Ochrobactrum chromiisoli]|uniref:Uncharacterized protein n=1 Tax=Ochrobactrum chromiisoli TaxID=2993941 RepID=A0ABT3QKZ3_9HYPH|nr:hypothetical protein [Ochrobactrum chromiisoli]MCX2696260.1 hypothetical protein [Ochrobactrum chromiisoli]
MVYVSAKKLNPHPIHTSHTTSEEIRDAFMHIKWMLVRKGWKTEDFTGLLGIPRQSWYQHGHKLESKGYRQISADALDMLRQETAQEIVAIVDGYHDPFGRERDTWTVGDLTTKSRTRALYRAALTGEAVVPGANNKHADELTNDEALLLRWFLAARRASREQLMSATGLSKYDVGRVGLHACKWGIPPTENWVDNLEQAIGV